MHSLNPQNNSGNLYQQSIEAVLAALKTDARHGLTERVAARATRTIWAQRAEPREAGSAMEKVPRPVSGFVGHSAAGCRGHLRGPVGARA